MLKDGLITLLAPLASGGCHKDALPRGYTFPAVVIHQYNGAQGYDMQGPTGPEDHNIQVDCYGKTQDERDALTVSVMDVLDSLTGDCGGATVQACYRERGPQDMPFMPSTTPGGPGYRAVLGYRVVVEVA